MIGAYDVASRTSRVAAFHARRLQRTWGRPVIYGVRKDFADSRLRVQGRFVKKEDEMLLRDFMQLV